jgi:hypothetical protein
MAAAFAASGFESPEARLKGLARDAIEAHGNNLAEAREHLHAALMQQPELVFSLINDCRFKQAEDQLLHTVWCADNNTKGSIRDRPIGPSKIGKAPQRGADAINEASAVARRSILDSLKCGETPIGDCTPAQAYASAHHWARSARFVTMLCTGLPPTEKIRNFRTPEEAEKIWKEAASYA